MTAFCFSYCAVSVSCCDVMFCPLAGLSLSESRLSHLSPLCFFKIRFKLLITHSFIPFTPLYSSSLPRRWHGGMARYRPLCVEDVLFRRSSSETWVRLPIVSPRCVPALEWPCLGLSYVAECGKKSAGACTRMAPL